MISTLVMLMIRTNIIGWVAYDYMNMNQKLLKNSKIYKTNLSTFQCNLI